MPRAALNSGRRRLALVALAALAAGLWLAGSAMAACTSGGLGLTAPTALAFPDTTLTGANQTVTSTLALTGDDQSGTGTGWRLTGTSTTLTAGAFTLPTTATTVTGATRTAGAGNCSLPANSVTYPVTLPAAATAPTAAKIFSAAAGAYSGTGAINISLSLAIAVPANARAGTYSSTWTLSLVSGP
ncbi:MAG: hypothetical protein J7513_09775 [Solirubrobacteraceae bacterium]|nr:hypothetical protein [Solirubrobacteraceae bacterium]